MLPTADVERRGNEGIQDKSCRVNLTYSMILQTLDSTWCEYEIQCARAASIPLLCVVDVDKQTVRSIVDYYFESGRAYLFDEQVIAYSAQGREVNVLLSV